MTRLPTTLTGFLPLILLAGCGTAPSAPTVAVSTVLPTIGHIERLDPALDALMSADAPQLGTYLLRLRLDP